MGVVRNSIEIVGISPEDKLPSLRGHIIEYCETENIHIPEDNASIGRIIKIEVEIDIKSNRLINAPSGKIVVVDGIKKIRIIYSEKHKEDKANILNLKLPYNTFIDLKNDCANLSKLKIHIADAYFSLIDGRRIYSHMLYILEMPYFERNDDRYKDLKAITSLSEGCGKDYDDEEKAEEYEGKENKGIGASTNLNVAEEIEDIDNIIPKMIRVSWSSII